MVNQGCAAICWDMILYVSVFRNDTNSNAVNKIIQYAAKYAGIHFYGTHAPKSSDARNVVVVVV